MAVLKAVRPLKELYGVDQRNGLDLGGNGGEGTGSDVRGSCVEGGRWVSTLPVDEGYAWFTLVGR